MIHRQRQQKSKSNIYKIRVELVIARIIGRENNTTTFGWWHAFCHWSGRKISIKSKTQPVKMFACSGTVLDATTKASSFVFFFNLRTTRHATALHSDVCRPTFETRVRELKIQIVTSCTSVDYIFFFQSSYNTSYNVYAKYARHCGC